MPNKLLFKQVRDAIEMEPSVFDQTLWGNEHEYAGNSVLIGCNTPACIAGHACFLSGYAITDGLNMSGTARKELELSTLESEVLFSGCWPNSWYKEENKPLPIHDSGGKCIVPPTVVEAINVLTRLINYGFKEE